MEVKFVKRGSQWVASGVEVDNDFNLHVETGGYEASVEIKQSTVKGGAYMYLATCKVNGGQSLDIDIEGSVYPKYIELSCNVQPTMAEITLKEDE